jgi:transposase
MGQNFIVCDRGQTFLLPPSVTDWVPEDHLVWTVLGAVEQFDLTQFYGAYRANGQGRPAYDPSMMVALLLYSYAVGVRSSRGIEKRCEEDVAFKVITALAVPDHSTIAEFRRRHQALIADLFVQVLALCHEAGLVQVGEIIVDGTKMRADASMDCNRGYESVVGEILEQAEKADRDEDDQFGDTRGDEPPAHLRTRTARREALVAAREKLKAERAAAQAAGEQVIQEVELELTPDRFETWPEGRQAWLREGRRVLERQRDLAGAPIPRGRLDRLEQVRDRLDEQLAFEHAANREYLKFRAVGLTKDGRRIGRATTPFTPPLVPEGRINTTDLDSKSMRTTGQPAIQGYNAQAVVTVGQIVIAAEVTNSPPDFGLLGPMVSAALSELDRAGITDRPGTVIADAGYWHKVQIEKLWADGMQALVPPDGGVREGTRPGWDGGMFSFMRQSLGTDIGAELYKLRKQNIEPTFGQIKHNRGINRFKRRGRAAARSEWRLITATHNLLKLHSHWVTPAIA